MSTVRIIAKVRAMSEEEVLARVPARILRDIKREDPRPQLRAFVVAHEGTANPTVLGFGRTVQRWFEGAVKAVERVLGLGTPVFNGHEPGTNEHGGRARVGEVIGKWVEKINGFLSTVAVAYIYPEFRDLPFDVASVEADLMIPGNEKEFEVQEPDVFGVSGIALGNSKVDKPAFPGATLQAALQAFAENHSGPRGGHETMTLEELRSAVKEGKFRPSDVFDATVLIADPFISEHVKEKEANIRGYNFRKLSELEDNAKKLQDENKALKDQAQAAVTVTLKSRAGSLLDAALKERKLDGDERFAKYARKSCEKGFAPTDEASLKKDVDKFLDTQVDEFKELFGEPVKGKGSGGGAAASGTGAAGGAGEDRSGTAGGAGEDMTDPKLNDLIPQD